MSKDTMGFMVTGSPSKKKSDAVDFLVRAAKESPQNQIDVAYLQYFGLTRRKAARFNIIEYIENGIPLLDLEKLAAHMGFGLKDFALLLLGMSDSTYRRRIKEEEPRLTLSESDIAVRYAHLLSLATELMEGSEIAAREWLRSPAQALGERTPLEMAATEAGARRVQDLIISLEYGMFS